MIIRDTDAIGFDADAELPIIVGTPVESSVHYLNKNEFQALMMQDVNTSRISQITSMTIVGPKYMAKINGKKGPGGIWLKQKRISTTTYF